MPGLVRPPAVHVVRRAALPQRAGPLRPEHPDVTEIRARSSDQKVARLALRMRLAVTIIFLVVCVCVFFTVGSIVI